MTNTLELLELVLSEISRLEGREIAVEWQTHVKPSAAHKGARLQKRVSAVVNCGAYSEIPEIKSGIESGERGPVGPLPWGKWLIFPYIIENKKVLYVRLNLKPDGVNVKHFVNGIKVERDEFNLLIPPSRRKSSEMPLTIAVAVENLIRFGAVELLEAEEAEKVA